MQRHSSEWWRKRVEELEKGDEVAALAKRHNVREIQLVWWQREFKRRGSAATEAPAQFVPVVVAKELPSMVTESVAPATVLEVIVEVGHGRVSLRGAVTTGHVEAIVRGLAGQC